MVMVVGEIIVYLVGVPWLAVDLHVGLVKAISLGFIPFLAGEAVKAALAAGLMPSAWWLTGRRHGVRDRVAPALGLSVRGGWGSRPVSKLQLDLRIFNSERRTSLGLLMQPDCEAPTRMSPGSRSTR